MMAYKLNVYDLNRRKTAVLENAFNITETQELNKIYTFEFSLPAADEKKRFIQPFHYVRYGEDGELYRIIKTDLEDSDVPVITVSCEHVIATLCDNVMFGSVNSATMSENSITTSQVITNLLAKQTKKNWTLGGSDFNRRFEYLWEQENLLNALYSIPKCFSYNYKWTFDTIEYPWKVYLQEIKEDVNPNFYIRSELNLLSSGSSYDYTDICTRIYPLGYGEGVNQLTIKNVNKINGVKRNYLQSPQEIINKYGLKEKVLVDRRYENAASLKEYAQTVLDSLQVPNFTRTFNVVDLYPITGHEIDNAKVGDICKMTMDDTITYITKTKRVLDDPGNLEIELSTKAEDIVDTIADLADRVRIETVYAQGATQLYQYSKDGNASSEAGKGLILSLYFPSEMRQINKVLMNVKFGPFRAYTNNVTVKGGSATDLTTGKSTTGITIDDSSSNISIDESESNISIETNSTGISVQDGDADISITEGDENVSITSEDITATITYGTQTSVGEASGIITEGDAEVDDHSHYVYLDADIFTVELSFDDISIDYKTYTIDGTGTHGHGIDDPEHGHDITDNKHSHDITDDKHSHDITEPNKGKGHDHKFSIGDHSHNIDIGIFEFGNPKNCNIYIGDSETPSNASPIKSKEFSKDISKWLIDEETGLIPRNEWIDIEIRPNSLAYIQTSIFVQGFVQSRGDDSY